MVSMFFGFKSSLLVFKSNMDNAMRRLDKLDDDVHGLTKIAERLAAQNIRLDHLDERLGDLADQVKFSTQQTTTTANRRRRRAKSAATAASN